MGKRGPIGTSRSAIPVVREMFETIDDQRVSTRGLTKRAGIAHGQLCRWRQGLCAPNVVTIDSVLNVLGYRLAIVPLEPAE